MSDHETFVRRLDARSPVWAAICTVCGTLGVRDHPADADMLCIEHDEENDMSGGDA